MHIWLTSVDKYSLTSQTWSHVAKMVDNRKLFRICAFIDKIFVFGGCDNEISYNSCLQFDTSNNSGKRRF